MKVGIQLYSVRRALKRDPYGTLAKVAAAGYRYVEAANHDAMQDDGVGFGVPAGRLKESLDKLGMRIIGCHINPLRLDRLPAVLDYHQALGNRQIGCDIEFYPYNDRDFLMGRCELFNRVGAMCKERGMRFYYHNHFQEFQKFGDQTVYELVMENTDPELVKIELDTYWVLRGGGNPIELMKKYRDRVVLLHQKDFPKQAPQPLVMYDGVIQPTADISDEVFTATKNPGCFTEIGTGVLDIQQIIDAGEECPDLKYMILEQDETRMPNEIDSIDTSMKAFRRFKNIEL